MGFTASESSQPVDAEQAQNEEQRNDRHAENVHTIMLPPAKLFNKVNNEKIKMLLKRPGEE